MSGPTQIQRPNCFVTAALLAAVLSTSACTRTSADNAHSHAAPAQPRSQQPLARPVTAQADPHSAMPTSEVAETLHKAESGDAAAMYRLGRMYAGGIGVEKDYVEAFDWYKRSAAKGNSDAMYSLGEAYERGRGVREDIQQAVNWYDKATPRGNKAAKAALDRLGEDFDR